MDPRRRPGTPEGRGDPEGQRHPGRAQLRAGISGELSSSLTSDLGQVGGDTRGRVAPKLEGREKTGAGSPVTHPGSHPAPR